MQRSGQSGLSIEVNTSQAQQNLANLNAALQRTQALGASASTGIAGVGTSSATASRGVSSLGASASTATRSTSALGGASTTTTRSATALGGALGSASSSASSLASSASSASSATSGLGSSLSSITSTSTTASSGLSSVGGSALGAYAGIIKVLGVAGAIVGLGTKLLGLVTATTEADIQIRILSERANTSAENLQILARGADTFGVSMDQLGSILADTQEKLGEFTSTEGGGASDFFDALKNNTKLTEDQIRSLAKTMTGKDGIEALRDMGQEMQKMGASSQEMRFVFESLGSDLGNLMPLINMSEKEWGAYGETLKEAGVIRTEEAIQKAVEMRAQQKALEDRFQGVKNKLSDQLLPVMNNLIGYLLDSSQGGAVLDGVLKGVVVTAKILGGAFSVLGGVLSAFGRIITGFIQTGKIVGETMAQVVMADGVVAKGKALWNGFGRQVENFGSTAYNALADVGDGVNGIFNAFDETTQQSDALSKSYASMLARQERGVTSLGKSTKQADEEEKASKEKVTKARAEANKQAQEALRLEQELQKLRENISDDYLTDEEKRQKQYEQRVSDIKKAFAGSDQDYYLAQAYSRFEGEKALSQEKLKSELYSFRKGEEQKIAEATATEIKQLEISKKYTDQEKEMIRESIVAKSAFEIEQFKKTQAEKKADILKEIGSYTGNTELKFEASLIGKTDDEKDISYQNRRAIEAYAELQEEKERIYSKVNENEALSHSQKLQKIAEIDKSYDEKRKAQTAILNEEMKQLQNAQIVSQLNSYSVMFGSLGDLVKGYSGENSKAYKSMIAIQKAANLTSVIMNGYTAISQAWALPYPSNIAAVIKATTQTGILQASLQAITPNLTGMAHNGISEVPREGTWLLDKGERVLNPQQNTDLTDFIVDQKNREMRGSQSAQNLRIINNLNPEIVGNFMQSPSGERTVMNSIASNASEIRELLGV